MVEGGGEALAGRGGARVRDCSESEVFMCLRNARFLDKIQFFLVPKIALCEDLVYDVEREIYYRPTV